MPDRPALEMACHAHEPVAKHSGRGAFWIAYVAIVGFVIGALLLAWRAG